MKKPTAREGHSSPPEGDRSSSSNIRSVREGNSSHRLSAPLWSGTSQSLPDASQIQLQTLSVNTVREGRSSQKSHDLSMVRYDREGHASLSHSSTLMALPNTYGPARRVDIMTTLEKEKLMDAHYQQTYANFGERAMHRKRGASESSLHED